MAVERLSVSLLGGLLFAHNGLGIPNDAEYSIFKSRTVRITRPPLSSSRTLGPQLFDVLPDLLHSAHDILHVFGGA